MSPATAPPVVPWAKGLASPSNDSAQRPKSRSVAVPVTCSRPDKGSYRWGEVIATAGGVVSTTVRVALRTPRLPLKSVAVQWTTVVPIGKKLGASLLSTGAPSTVSVAAGAPRKAWIAARAAAAPPVAVASTVSGAGTAGVTGGVVAWTTRTPIRGLALPV